MSKIQGKPFIESVLDSLNDTQKTTLLSYVNGTNKNPQFRSLINSENWITKKVGEDTGDYDKVSHIILETYNKTYTGYLIYNASYCVLIAYALNSQELNVLDINLTNKSYRLIKEPLSILELRFELEEAKEGTDVIEDVANAFAEGTLKVGASGIDATDEAAGKVLTANGSSGAAWVKNNPAEIQFLSTAPTEANTDGSLKFVVLSEEPLEYFNGYYYIITEAEV